VGNTYTEAQKNATIKYLKEKTDDIRVRAPKGTKDRWREAADAAGVSLQRFIIDAVEAAVAVTEEKTNT
jgi:predicted HicB family RNase H-like nuclease